MLVEIDYEYDKKMLLREAEEREGYEPFVDPKTGAVIQKWLIKRNVTGYGRMITEEFEKKLGVSIKPRFYIQEQGFTLPFHRDRKTTCAVNFILSTSKDPITFRLNYNTFSFKYKTAIVDVTEEHMVTASKEDRYLFKLSIFDKSFDEVRELLFNK
tara:strand:+ start:1559 stop:2026 length:468 start_codon:yes stop_codon:yes gene_type:complete